MNFGLGTLILQEKTLPIYYLQKKNRMEISVLATTFTIIVERKHKYIYTNYMNRNHMRNVPILYAVPEK